MRWGGAVLALITAAIRIPRKRTLYVPRCASTRSDGGPVSSQNHPLICHGPTDLKEVFLNVSVFVALV